MLYAGCMASPNSLLFSRNYFFYKFLHSFQLNRSGGEGIAGYIAEDWHNAVFQHIYVSHQKKVLDYKSGSRFGIDFKLEGKMCENTNLK